MSKNNNIWLKFRRWIEHHISNKVKDNTGNDLFDWLSIIVLFGGGVVAVSILFLKGFIDLGDTISFVILWFTAIAIFKYTKETYWLKKVQQQELEEVVRTRKDDFLPIVIIESQRSIGEDSPKLDYKLVNLGKGVAKEVLVFVDGDKKHGSNKTVSPGPNNGKDSHLEYNFSSDEDMPKKVPIRLEYKDIYDRNLVTLLFLEKQGNKYTVNRGSWKFFFKDEISEDKNCPCGSEAEYKDCHGK